MKDLPAREKIDLTEKVARYLVLAGTLDKASAPDDYDMANELSLELAMVLPGPIYRAMVEAAAHPDGKVNPATVAVMMRREILASFERPQADALRRPPPEGSKETWGGPAFPCEDDLQPEQVAFHTPGVTTKPRSKAH